MTTSGERGSSDPVGRVAFPYRWHWHRPVGRKVLVRGAMNSAPIEFEDGYRAVVSRNGLRRR